MILLIKKVCLYKPSCLGSSGKELFLRTYLENVSTHESD